VRERGALGPASADRPTQRALGPEVPAASRAACCRASRSRRPAGWWAPRLPGSFPGADCVGEGCGYQTTAHEARYHDYSTGFRCCTDVAGAPQSAAGTSGASKRRRGKR
jgi:hypothetical protein